MPLLGGIRPPVAALLVLLLSVAAATALILGRTDSSSVSRAVLASQQHVAEDGATALRASLDESTSDLQRAAALANAATPAAPDEVLSTLGSVYQKWRGTAVVDPSSGALLASRGENVPLATVDVKALPAGLPPRLVTTKSGETRLLVFAVLSQPAGKRLLIASDTLSVPSITTGDGRSLIVLDASGTILASNGPDARGKAARQLSVDAARSAHGKRPSETAASGGFDSPSGSLLGETANGRRTVAGYASITSGIDANGKSAQQKAASSGRLGLSVLTTVQVPQDGAARDHRLFAVIAAGVLLFLAAAVTWVLYAVLQRPLLRLHLEARRLARGELSRPVDAPRFAESARIGAALESMRRELTGAPSHPAPRARTGRGLGGTRTVLIVCGVVLLSWAAPLLFLFNRAEQVAVIPQQLVTDQRQRTETAADRVREGLNEGYADVAAIATVVGDGASAEQAHSVLVSTLAAHARYRSLYVVDQNGAVVTQAGDSPHTPTGLRTKHGVGLVDDTLTQPVIAARAPVAGKTRRTVVGEFDIPYLGAIMDRPGLGKVWLVDADDRIVASNQGFRAFQGLHSGRLESLAKSATSKSSGALLTNGQHALAAAAPLTGGGEANALKTWHVVSEQPAGWLDLPEYVAQRRTMLAGMLGLAAAATCLGWLHIVIVRPLRALADSAEALAGGDRKTVLYPAHHDEVGSVVRSLELIRQQLVERHRGHTAPRVPRPRTAHAGRNARRPHA
ncbi:HAMP domain-containing protein [Streptomyces sp. SPB162]|uniref:HAMP domain-containing protein n=1 Tax=Streptomyces sp. SPB162 TaxID=2940560 RepID=UPI0024066D5C|nr:HAMP domain-containing protein [Streptomyces sp. SPB162]MDF9814237.1 HAMP domain-containing protein [Streptomyces sp. SPB162]